MHRIQKYVPLLSYVGLSLVVVGPLLLPGFVLTMDMVFTPQLRPPDHVDNTFVFYWTLHLLNYILPADMIQKVLLISIFAVAGLGMHRLIVALRGDHEQQLWNMAAYIAGLLFVVNPFTYDRLMAGQYGVLLGYALLPWFVKSWMAFVQNPARPQIVRAVMWLVAISIVSIHAIGFAVLAAIAGLYVYAPSNRQQRVQVVRAAAMVVGIFALVSSYWLVPSVLGQGRIADSVATFGASQRQSFQAADTNGETSLGAVLGLQGFWQDTRGLYVLPIDYTPQWGIVRLVVWFVIGLGVVRAWKAQRRAAIAFACLGLAVIVLSLDIFGELLTRVVPFFAGYREPQKFVALLALTYGYFAAWGAYALMVRARRWRAGMQYGAFGALAVCILAYTSPLLWGTQGQLRAASYPGDWQTINAQLAQDAHSSLVLYLPWHLYMGYDFAGRIIASPAPDYFDAQMIVSDDPELAGVAPQFPNTMKRTIQQRILPNAEKKIDVARDLLAYNIRYVLLAKESDYQAYNYLKSQPHLRLIKQTEHFELYRIEEK